jgi:hypothetical protein
MYRIFGVALIGWCANLFEKCVSFERILMKKLVGGGH